MPFTEEYNRLLKELYCKAKIIPAMKKQEKILCSENTRYIMTSTISQTSGITFICLVPEQLINMEIQQLQKSTVQCFYDLAAFSPFDLSVPSADHLTAQTPLSANGKNGGRRFYHTDTRRGKLRNL